MKSAVDTPWRAAVYWLLIVAACVATATASAKAVESFEPTRLVVIGDVHGDYAQLRAMLLLADLIDPTTDQWFPGFAASSKRGGGANGSTAAAVGAATDSPAGAVSKTSKGTHLLFMGDLVDRGPDDKKVLEYVVALQQQANVTSGGTDRVFLILGNHELMNLQGHFHYVHPEATEAYGGLHHHRRLLAAGTPLGDFLRQTPLIHTAFDSVFVHAGLSPSFAEQGIDAINKEAADALSSDWFHSPLFDVKGPVWTRSLIYAAASGDCAEVEQSLKLLGLQRMVVGHTPQRSGRIETYCDDRLVAVDVGLSKWMYGKLAALELSRDAATGEVEMREISGRRLSGGDEKRREPESETAPETTAGAADTLEGALGKDPLVLNELFELIREVEKKEDDPSGKKGEL